MCILSFLSLSLFALNYESNVNFPSAHTHTVAPNITIRSNYVDALEEGNAVQIECLVESYPAPMSYWVKETLLYSHSNDVVQRVLEQRWVDSDWKNIVSSSGWSGNEISNFNQYIFSFSVEILVSSTTHSTSNLQCTHSEKYRIVDEKVSQYRTRMILTINNLDQHDAGNYVCVSGEKNTRFSFEIAIRSWTFC